MLNRRYSLQMHSLYNSCIYLVHTSVHKRLISKSFYAGVIPENSSQVDELIFTKKAPIESSWSGGDDYWTDVRWRCCCASYCLPACWGAARVKFSELKLLLSDSYSSRQTNRNSMASLTLAYLNRELIWPVRSQLRLLSLRIRGLDAFAPRGIGES